MCVVFFVCVCVFFNFRLVRQLIFTSALGMKMVSTFLISVGLQAAAQRDFTNRGMTRLGFKIAPYFQSGIFCLISEKRN